MSLTDAKIRSAKPGPHGAWIADRDGLYLRITANGAKSFYVRRHAGKRRIQERLGRWPQLTLADARKRAESFNPDAPESPPTFAAVIEQYEKRRILPRYKRPELFAAYRKAIIARLGHLKPQQITTAHLSRLIIDYADERGLRTADALRSHLRTAIGWACEQGWMENCAAGISSKTSGYEYRARERTLTDDEIRAVWSSDASHTPLLRGLLLTGLRITELKLAHADEIADSITDRNNTTYDGPVLHIPSERSKNKDPHWVYVTPTLAAQFESEDGQLFAELTTTGTQSWVKRWCERVGMEPWTPHDLRRTFATRLNGDLSIAPHIVEKMLNHRMQGVMAVYNRAEYVTERIAAYKAWEKYLKRIVKGER